jgi:hypothetical protein
LKKFIENLAQAVRSSFSHESHEDMKLSSGGGSGGGFLSCSLHLETASKGGERLVLPAELKNSEHTTHQPLLTERQSPKARPTIVITSK